MPDNGASSAALSDFGLSLIQAFEGFVDTFYCDKAPTTTRGHRTCLDGEGALTIGWGHKCENGCPDIKDEDLPISREFGDQLLRSDVQIRVDAVNNAISAQV